MSDYYFDIETYSRTQNPDFENDPVIAITYRRIDSRNGEPQDNLNILKAWESSEKNILQKFYTVFQPEEKWEFIPIGCNLVFDFTTLIYRFRTIGISLNAKNLFAEHPYLDIQHLLVMCNRGSFKGATLEKFSGKRYSGAKVREWYEQQNYSAIKDYIENEAECFIRLYQFFVKNLPDLWLKFAKESKIII